MPGTTNYVDDCTAQDIRPISANGCGGVVSIVDVGDNNLGKSDSGVVMLGVIGGGGVVMLGVIGGGGVIIINSLSMLPLKETDIQIWG